MVFQSCTLFPHLPVLHNRDYEKRLDLCEAVARVAEGRTAAPRCPPPILEPSLHSGPTMRRKATLSGGRRRTILLRPAGSFWQRMVWMLGSGPIGLLAATRARVMGLPSVIVAPSAGRSRARDGLSDDPPLLPARPRLPGLSRAAQRRDEVVGRVGNVSIARVFENGRYDRC
jgi:hypothetical protein